MCHHRNRLVGLLVTSRARVIDVSALSSVLPVWSLQFWRRVKGSVQTIVVIVYFRTSLSVSTISTVCGYAWSSRGIYWWFMPDRRVGARLKTICLDAINYFGLPRSLARVVWDQPYGNLLSYVLFATPMSVTGCPSLAHGPNKLIIRGIH